MFQITFLFPSFSTASLDHFSPSFTWCGYYGKISQGCGCSRSPFSYLHLVWLLQITFPLPSLGAAILENLTWVRPFQITFLFPSLGAASLDHLSPSFTWCGCSGKISQGCSCSISPFFFLHLV